MSPFHRPEFSNGPVLLTQPTRVSGSTVARVPRGADHRGGEPEPLPDTGTVDHARLRSDFPRRPGAAGDQFDLLAATPRGGANARAVHANDGNNRHRGELHTRGWRGAGDRRGIYGPQSAAAVR